MVLTYKNPDDFVPIQGKLRGLGVVPIWFISREDYNTAKNDGVFTMGEFNSLSSLIKASALYGDITSRRAFGNAHEKHRGLWHT
jgi:hypothetical protein